MDIPTFQLSSFQAGRMGEKMVLSSSLTEHAEYAERKIFRCSMNFSSSVSSVYRASPALQDEVGAEIHLKCKLFSVLSNRSILMLFDVTNFSIPQNQIHREENEYKTDHQVPFFVIRKDLISNHSYHRLKTLHLRSQLL